MLLVMSGIRVHEAGGGLIVMPDTFNMVHRRTTIGLAARHRLSAIYPLPFFAREGGLIAYGPDEIDMFRRIAALYRGSAGSSPANADKRSNRPPQRLVMSSLILGQPSRPW